MKIMIVDDSRAARMLIKSILTEYNQNIELVEGADGQEAIDQYIKNRPDITFLDLTMPVMDGYEALEMIIAEDPEAVVIVLTADIQEKSVQKCMDIGATMVMKKLPRKEIVFEVLDKLVSKLEGSLDG